MARQLRAAAPNIVYHVLNRANAREGIFQKEEDYAAFEKILVEAREKFDMRILAFCIMPNHWHLILHPKTAESLSQFMRWITHTHTQRYHTHYHSIGYGLKKIRYALKCGSPFGESEWVSMIAEKLGLESTLRKRGRPKKGT